MHNYYCDIYQKVSTEKNKSKNILEYTINKNKNFVNIWENIKK